MYLLCFVFLLPVAAVLLRLLAREPLNVFARFDKVNGNTFVCSSGTEATDSRLITAINNNVARYIKAPRPAACTHVRQLRRFTKGKLHVRRLRLDRVVILVGNPSSRPLMIAVYVDLWCRPEEQGSVQLKSSAAVRPPVEVAGVTADICSEYRAHAWGHRNRTASKCLARAAAS